ncbi:PSD1 and planctomycete cytochrome C domain-containing protein, partial [Pirellulales bacterium]|nr:PSD1 and planctomycete cytochrome C domain-containing protein [Pirellulales bacterium]
MIVKFTTSYWLSAMLALVVLPAAARAIADGPAKIDYIRDVRPILAENCYKCHGPDDAVREAGLRLDQHAGATQELESGNRAIVPDDPSSSELLRRVMSADPDVHMPPLEVGKQLTEREQQILSQWIAAGARYDVHWAYVAPQRPPPPVVKEESWIRTEIDRFIKVRLEQHDISQAPPADRATLLRRLSLDLCGLPPTIEQLDRLLADNSPRAYESAVDEFLRSPHFGEKLAQDWLDLARFGDTNGYHADSHRDMWLFRDWVINAFNTNMPFDQFVIEQIAGDLLPEATPAQQIASAFNRNAAFNEEGGADPEEGYVIYAIDRTNTTGQALMGLTVGCAQCHSHKYDPISHKEYYQLLAFFNSIEGELGGGGENGHHSKPVPPVFKAVSPLSGQESTVMVMKAMQQRRPTFVLTRGDYQQPAEQVQPEVPAIFPPLRSDLPRDRTALAAWLVESDHPLVSRVRVNHLWKSLFGTGLVRTAGDFGTQGSLPSHPQLLDWLAVEFVESGWDTKALLKKIVMSATYRQQSSMNEVAEFDPENRLLYRMPRRRMAAEQIRDMALTASGLLNRTVGGPSVRPYQPEGHFAGNTGRKWKQST